MSNIRIEDIKPKSISFKESIIFTKIARKIKLRNFKAEIMELVKTARNQEYTDEEKKVLLEIKKIYDEKEKKEKFEKFNLKRVENIGINIGIDVGLYILENIEYAENDLIDLISSYAKLDKDLIKDADFEIILKIFKMIWENGLFKAVTMFLENDSMIDDLKKTK